MLTGKIVYRWWCGELNMSVSMGGMIQTRGTPKYSERNVSQCHFLATNPSWTGLGSNPGLRSGRRLHEAWYRHYGHKYGVVTRLETVKSHSLNSIVQSRFYKLIVSWLVRKCLCLSWFHSQGCRNFRRLIGPGDWLSYDGASYILHNYCIFPPLCVISRPPSRKRKISEGHRFLEFWSRLCGTCWMPSFWRLKFGGSLYIFGK